MDAPMQPFIAEAMRVIAENLSATSNGAPEKSSPVLENHQVLDTSMADSVNDGSLIFPNLEGDSEPDWCVLATDSKELNRASHVFHFRGRLRGGMKASDFVERAYELILMRDLDDEGRGIYPSLLETYQLTKREVLKILASSTEAQGLPGRYVIVPEPSSWLSKLGIAPGADSSFPPLVVKTQE